MKFIIQLSQSYWNGASQTFPGPTRLDACACATAKKGLVFSFALDQMCHLAGPECFYFKLCCFHWPQFQIIKTKTEKWSSSGLFDFSDVDLVKQMLFQGPKSYSCNFQQHVEPAHL